MVEPDPVAKLARIGSGHLAEQVFAPVFASVSNLVGNGNYQFEWRIKLGTSGSFKPFRTTNHRIFIMRKLTGGGAYNTTVKRLGFVTSLLQGTSDASTPQGVSGLSTMVERIQGNLIQLL